MLSRAESLNFMRISLIAVSVLVLGFIGFWLYMSRERGNPVENFTGFVSVFGEQYALFEVKRVDWDSLVTSYAPRVTPETTDDELFAILVEMLRVLDDKHCYIYRFNEIYFSGFDLPPLNYAELLSFDFRIETGDFRLDVVEKNYLLDCEKSLRVISTLPPIGIRKIFTTGWLPDSIAYIHMTEMSNRADEVESAVNDFFSLYGSASGFVIDIRDNIGGYSLPARELARRFTDSSRVYAVSRLRNGSGSFSEPDFWVLEPYPGCCLSEKPVALLVNKNTQSAAELFALMLRDLPNVTVTGDTTSGIFADTHTGKLPNGWEYRLSIRRTSDGNDRLLEDAGIVPDVVIANTPSDLNRGHDSVLEYAIEHIDK